MGPRRQDLRTAHGRHNGGRDACYTVHLQPTQTLFRLIRTSSREAFGRCPLYMSILRLTSGYEFSNHCSRKLQAVLNTSQRMPPHASNLAGSGDASNLVVWGVFSVEGILMLETSGFANALINHWSTSRNGLCSWTLHWVGCSGQNHGQ